MNILPIAGTRWTTNNCSVDALTFTFNGKGSATAKVTDSEIFNLTSTCTISAILEPNQSGYSQDVYMTIRIKKATSEYYYECILNNNFHSLYTTVINTPTGTYDEFVVTLHSDEAVIVHQLEIDVESQSIDEIVDNLRKELPQLVSDYNTYDMEITNEEEVIALITANLLQEVDIQGHFAVTFTTSADAEVILRIYDDIHKCLYTPIVNTFFTGKHTIGFPHSYLKSKAGFHNFYVTLQATQGTIFVPTRGAMYSLDAAHMAVRIMDADGVISDLTAKTGTQLPDPIMFYAVSVVNEIATVKHIEPNQVGVSNWSNDFAISDVIDAAIEFNGRWEVVNKRRAFLTDEFPTICFVDTSNNLWYREFTNEESLHQIATEVVKVAALRGWRYTDAFINNDVGYVVAYIKTDGYAYMRQYSYNETTKVMAWSIEEKLPFTTELIPYKTITISRANDFRMAFSIEDAEGYGYSLLSRRYYQADSVETVNITPSIGDISIGFAEPYELNTEDAWNEDNNEAFVKFDHNVTIDEELFKNDIYLIDNASKKYMIETIERIDEYTYKFTFIGLGLAGFAEPIKFGVTTTSAYSGPVHSLSGGARFSFNNANANALPLEDMSPKAFHEEHIKITGEVAIELKQIMYPEIHYEEAHDIKATMDIGDIILTPIVQPVYNYIEAYDDSLTHLRLVDLDLTIIILTKVNDEPI